MTSSLNVFEKILSRAHSNYLAQISIEMTGTSLFLNAELCLCLIALGLVLRSPYVDANNKMNDVLGRMTAVCTLSPLLSARVPC